MTCYPWPYIKLLFSLGAQRLGSASTLQICKQTCLLSSRVFYGFESLQLQPFASISHHPPARRIKLAISNSQTHPNCQLNRALGDSFLVRIVNTQQRLTLFPFVNKQGAGTESCRPTSRHPKYFSQATRLDDVSELPDIKTLYYLPQLLVSVPMPCIRGRTVVFRVEQQGHLSLSGKRWGFSSPGFSDDMSCLPMASSTNLPGKPHGMPPWPGCRLYQARDAAGLFLPQDMQPFEAM